MMCAELLVNLQYSKIKLSHRHGASDTAARNERSEGSQCRTDLNACVQGEEIGPNEVQNAEPKSTYIAE